MERSFKYPKYLKGSFLWNTSVIKNNGNSIFKQKFKINKFLPLKQDFTDFSNYINKSKNKYVISFPNLYKDSILIIPMPVHGKNFATLKDFIDNASEKQQKEFWKEVATIAIDFMNKNIKIWISTHGFGVPYLHVRISLFPKYYFNDDLKKE